MVGNAKDRIHVVQRRLSSSPISDALAIGPRGQHDAQRFDFPQRWRLDLLHGNLAHGQLVLLLVVSSR